MGWKTGMRIVRLTPREGERMRTIDDLLTEHAYLISTYGPGSHEEIAFVLRHGDDPAFVELAGVARQVQRAFLARRNGNGQCLADPEPAREGPAGCARAVLGIALLWLAGLALCAWIWWEAYR